jgi:molecular chaperone GrpE
MKEEKKCKCEENCHGTSCPSDHNSTCSDKKLSELEKPIEKVIIVEQNIDYKDKYLRMLAEVENTKKRIQKEKYETINFAIENTLCEFIPALDNLENALKFSSSSSEEVKNWASGFQMIFTQFRDIMHSHGIVAFHSEGNLFDPHFHEAMEIVETTLHPEGTILTEFAKGYKSRSRTIRPAKVKVAKKPTEVEEQKEEENLNKNNPK